MRKVVDLTGKRFSRLTVIKRAEDYISPKGYKMTMWLCKCDCSNEVIVQRSRLVSGGTQSCGCLQKEIVSKVTKKYNQYDLSGEYGIGYTSKGEEFYFDLEDYDLIKDYCWFKNKQGYTLTNVNLNGKRTSLFMHDLIMDCPDNMEIDHQYGKSTRSDNRKYNLRIGTHSDNMKNRKLNSNNKSGTKGVIFHKPTNKWMAYITSNKKRHTKFFLKKEDAIIWRKNIENELHKEWSYDNSQSQRRGA